MFDGGDIDFVGPSYTAPSYLQSAEECINFFVEIAKGATNPKMPKALLGAPGLATVFSTQTGEVRGAWVLPGSLTALFVTGNTVYLVTISSPGTQAVLPTFTVKSVGTLNTSTGRVCIRDNGVLFNGQGGYAVLVDGVYGYFYQLSGGPSSVTFTASITTGSPTITFDVGVLSPRNLLIGNGVVISDASAGIPGLTTISAISYNANTITMNANATKTVTDELITVNIPVFGQITDSAFLGADRVAFVEGWLIFNQPGTRTFFTNAPQPYTLTFAGAFYALKDSSTDNLITLFENTREVWMIGERTSEVWATQGATNSFGFSRLPGVGPQIGCSAKHSITRVGPNLIWLASNEQGQNFVAMTDQYSWLRTSNHAIENLIASFPVISDAIGDAYEENGHFMYVLTFPTADMTLVYDLSTEMWWKRLSWNQAQGRYHRHRGNVLVNFGNLRLWGDYQTGQVHRQSRDVYTDAGMPLRALRRTPHVWSRENRNRVFQGSLQVEFAPGVGLSTGQGSAPRAMFRWSDDGGETWSNEHFVSVGAIGRTKNRAMVRRIGEARDRVYEVSYTEPTRRDIIGATLFAEGEQ